MPRIRLVYASVILYASIFVRVAAGVGFMVVAGRKLPTPEFAALGILLSVSLIISSTVYLWSFWAQRQASRLDEYAGRREAARPITTGAIVTLAYAPLAVLLYLLVSIPEAKILGVPFKMLAMGSLYVAPNTLVFYFREVTGTVNPQLIGYARSIFDGGRLALGYYTMAVEEKGFMGAVEALVIPLLVSISVYVGWHWRYGYLRRDSIDASLVKEWFGNVKVPVAHAMLLLSRILQRPFISWTTGSDVAVAYLNVGLSSEAPLIHAGSAASPASYAIALRRPTKRDLETGIALYFLFAGLLLALYTSIPHAIATMYNPKYAEASIVIVLVAVYALFQGLASTVRHILMGLDTADTAKAATGPLMWKAIRYGLAATLIVYLAATPLTYMLKGNPLWAVIVLVSLLAASRLYLSAAYLSWLRARAGAGVPVRDLAAVITGIAFSIVYARATGASTITVWEFWEGIAEIAPHAVIIAGIYATAVLALSPTARRITRAGLSKIARR